jgi:NAD(P)-dependent dehydrogenase (short-subunit alcohol dehydrogenase family)
MDTNLFGVIHGISTFLPSIQSTASASSPAAIIITGSKQGITNPPGNPAYNASKAAVKTLAEHLSWDLRPTKEKPKTSISVHLLVPGWTYTGLSGGAPGSTEGKPAGAWSAEQVVDYLEGKMKEGKFYVICPDNDVDEETDRRRMMWSVGDVVEGRPPLTRWREEWKAKADDGMKGMKL